MAQARRRRAGVDGRASRREPVTESLPLRHSSVEPPRSGGANELLRSGRFKLRVASLRALNELVRYIQAK